MRLSTNELLDNAEKTFRLVTGAAHSTRRAHPKLDAVGEIYRANYVHRQSHFVSKCNEAW